MPLDLELDVVEDPPVLHICAALIVVDEPLDPILVIGPHRGIGLSTMGAPEVHFHVLQLVDAVLGHVLQRLRARHLELLQAVGQRHDHRT